MKFRELRYKKPKGAEKGSVKKQGSKSSGKNIQRSSECVQETKGDGSADTGDS